MVALLTTAPLSFHTMDDTHFFPSTGQAVMNATYDFVTANGGAQRTGLPIADPVSTAGVTQRTFQRARIDRSDVTGELTLGAIGPEYLRRAGLTFTPSRTRAAPRTSAISRRPATT
ncbi:MAG: hypothetical protein AVDCRST_MAG77-2548 [uncultured Chloroflexi bacterium]|uniref:Uncharacterized protein n=1 Tax=uncultured Chloroflexota bacterium TaxID=166587 RepID=A0A6J4IUC6_9CHLR|nr:MAG: hypothetical protein AVDCRST_MAG77-2548 [uncultured Chloroflexota bacterium]